MHTIYVDTEKTVTPLGDDDDDDEDADNFEGNRDAAQLLVDMLGVKFSEAYNAMRAFRDPNEAADWLLNNPGIAPPAHRALAYPANSHNRSKRASTPNTTDFVGQSDELD
jgi:hypothetical protein